jgi:hypothetical protein
MPISFASSGILPVPVPVLIPLAGAAIDLWFANNQYYDSGAGGLGQSVTSYLSLTRASTAFITTAAGTLTSFGSNTLRIADSGLLIEGSQTNYVLFSQDFSNANWTKTNSSIGTTTTAPDGTSTAQKLVEAAGSAEHYVTATVGGTGNDSNESIYVKAAERSWVAIANATRSVVANFNVGTGVVGTFTGFSNTSIEALANGWYRCKAYASAGQTDLRIQLGDADTGTGGTYSYTGDGSSGLFIWGGQLERGIPNLFTSYIPTTTVSVARAADAISPIAALFTDLSNMPFSVVSDVKASFGPSSQAIIADSASDIATNNIDSNTVASTYDGVTFPQATLGNSLTFTIGAKVGVGMSAGGRSIVAAGGTVTTGGGPVAQETTLVIGRGNGGGHPLYAYLRRLTVWTSKLADTTLQGFTYP